jgi:predicted ATPase/DNA-binding SARP family transcriptional activator
MEYLVLGPLELREDGRPVAVAGRKERALLLALVLRPNEPVPRQRLLEALWDDEAPASASGALYVFASHLRAALGREAVRTRDGGYELVVDPEDVDAHRFERLAREGRDALEAGRHEAATGLLREALALWRGPALGDLAELRFAQPDAARLEELRLAALEDLVEAELLLGGGADRVAELETLVAQHPRRERLWGHLMRALYAAGRQADALDAYRRARTTLVEEYGVEPGPALRRLQQAVLHQDPALELETAASPPVDPLPAVPTPLVGREEELQRLADLLRRPEVHLVTVTGIGGIGKTRVAIEAARRLGSAFRDGVFFVELLALRDPALVLDAVAQALDVAVRGEQPVEQVLRERLRDRSTLIVLDNFEHLLDAAPAVASALAQMPGLKLLVTSVAALRVAAEHEFALEPLAHESAVELFVERARAVRHDFALSAENVAAVGELCRRLEGLPLAIELVAARTRLLPPTMLLARLRGRLDVPSAELRDLPARQRTLRATIDWSYGVLEPAEQRLLARLAVFTGGCTLEAIDAVCGAGDDLVDLLGALADKSFLRRTGEQEPRFWLLETVREYALERLELSGELDERRRRHASYFLALAERAEPDLVGPKQVELLDRLQADHENMRAALAWSAAGDVALHCRLAAALGRFWHVRGYVGEGYRILRGAVELGAGEPAWVRAKVLDRAAALALWHGRHDVAPALLEESTALYRRIGDSNGIAHSLLLLGTAAAFAGDYDRAIAVMTEAAELHRSIGNMRYVAVAVGNVGASELNRDNYARAAALFAEGLELSRQVGDTLSVSVALVNLGIARIHAGEPEGTRELFEEALSLSQELGFKEQIVCAIMGLALLALGDDDAERSAELMGAADAIASVSALKLQRFEVRVHDELLAELRSRLGEERYAQAWSNGSADHELALARA